MGMRESEQGRQRKHRKCEGEGAGKIYREGGAGRDGWMDGSREGWMDERREGIVGGREGGRDGRTAGGSLRKGQRQEEEGWGDRGR